MLVPPVDRRVPLPLRVAVLLAALALASPCHAQLMLRGQRAQIIQGGQVVIGFAQPNRRNTELTAPHVDVISGNTASRLEQVRALAADKNWDEAVDILRELSTDSTDRVVALDGERYVSLPTYCQWELARLPADALAAYRRRVDALAEKCYREGMANRDEAQLGRVVDELFCSTWGDDAFLALGELALERGDCAAARRYWEQISPLTRDPNGKPLWLSLRGVDLNKHWPEIERRWPLRQQPPTWLAYPDTDIDLADLRARLALVSIRAGELDRAALELDALRRWHPEAAGRLGGQDGPYAAALEKLLAAAKEWPTQPPDRNWPTFAGAQSRSPHAASVGPLGKTGWANPIKLSANETPRPRVAVSFDQNQATQVRESDQALSYFPVVVDGLLLYSDATTVSAASLATGKPAITPDGTLFRIEATAGDTNTAMLRSQYVAAGVPRFSLTVIDGIAYARVGPVTTARIQAAGTPPVGERLVGIDLKRDGLLAFQAKPDDEGWSFDGTPVGDGRRIYVAMRHGDVTPHAYVACFDAMDGTRPLWRTSIGSADTPAAGNGDEITHNLLSLVGDRIYFNTNLGLVAALDAEQGHIQWLRRYDRKADISTAAGTGSPLHYDRDPSPCLVDRGLVIVAPSDTPAVFALDADTGRMIWSNDKLADVLHLLGVADDSLIATGNRFCSLDVHTGRVRFAWPESEHAGIRGMGRGAIAGNEVFWPTRKEIYFFDARTGARTRPPIDLSSVSEGGANLAVANGYLIVAGRTGLTAAGPAPAQPPDKSNQLPKVAKTN